jgi:drug/metabolite transporter (DMT)-like permease
VVWGSTYLAIAVMVRTMPPLLGAGARFAIAGAVMLAFLAARGRVVRLDRSQLWWAFVVGTLLMGANAIVCVAEQEVPSSLAALLIASVPLWVILMRAATGDRPARRSIAAVVVGFAGVALLLLPGEQTAGASLAALLAVVGASVMWASGSFASPRVSLPRDPLVSTGWQMLLGGIACAVAGGLAGEAGDLDAGAFSLESLLAFAYLISFGSWLAFTAYAWLLQNAPVSRVATYAYVNPVIAIVLGALLNDETITPTAIVGAAIIVLSVALVIRTEARRTGARRGSRARSASASA